MHEELNLTHTDLKPENVLLKLDSRKISRDSKLHPVNVQRKAVMFEGEKVEDSEEEETI